MPQLPHYLSREGINGIHTSRRAATDHIIAGGSATLWLGRDSTTLGGADVLETCDGRDGLFGQT